MEGVFAAVRQVDSDASRDPTLTLLENMTKICAKGKKSLAFFRRFLDDIYGGTMDENSAADLMRISTAAAAARVETPAAQRAEAHTTANERNKKAYERVKARYHHSHLFLTLQRRRGQAPAREVAGRQ